MSSFFASFSSRPFSACVGGLVEVDQIHRGLVRPSVQRTPECPDAADDGTVEIRQRGGDHAHRERGRVKLVFGVEHERNVHRADVRFRRGFAQEQVQEMRGDVRVVGLRLDALAVFRELIPIQQHRRERREQPVARRERARAVNGAFRFQAAQHRATRAQHVHRVRVGGQQFQRRLERVRQPAHPGEERAIFRQLRAGRQLAVQQQVSHLLEPAFGGEVFDGIAAVRKAESPPCRRCRWPFHRR